MQLIRRDRLQEFMRVHLDSSSSLRSWSQIIVSNHFKNPVELKRTFGSADYVKPYWVFNISGNKYRLITLVTFGLGLVSVEGVYTHADYDKGKWK